MFSISVDLDRPPPIVVPEFMPKDALPDLARVVVLDVSRLLTRARLVEPEFWNDVVRSIDIGGGRSRL